MTMAFDKFPELMSAKHMMEAGMSRPLSYHLLSRADMPVVTIGRRKFMLRDPFVHWLAEQSQGGRNNDD
jgi:hypothetical protein